MTISTRVSRRIAAAVLLLAAVPHTLIACATTPASSVASDPRTWVAIPCQTCTKAGVRVETRRSIDDRGRAGRYVYAHVSNLNPHAVTLTLDLVAHGPPSGDPDILRKQWQLTLPAGGDSTSSTVLAAEYSDIATASVYAVERF
jgi:hypothetical protein